MANSEEKPIFMHKNPPSSTHNQSLQGEDFDDREEEVWDKGCDCFGLFCLKLRRRDYVDETDSLLHHEGGRTSETWWQSELKKIKEFSEKIAGPKWKNFVRKMGGYWNKRKTQRNRFQYDPSSYALNFDDGGDEEGDEYLVRDFSHRFAAPLADDHQKQRAGTGS